jgi:hypothetical protein
VAQVEFRQSHQRDSRERPPMVLEPLWIRLIVGGPTPSESTFGATILRPVSSSGRVRRQMPALLV